MRAACKPRGLLAAAWDGQRQSMHAQNSRGSEDNDLQPILDGVGGGGDEGRGLDAEFESRCQNCEVPPLPPRD